MMMFWIAAAILAATSAGLVIARVARVGESPAADPSLNLYRRAISEIDDLAARDLLQGEELRATRAEAGRRLLSAAQTQGLAQPTRRTTRVTAAVLACAGPAMALAAYLVLGSPGAPDRPFRSRLADWVARPEAYAQPELAAALRFLAEKHPNDPEPLRRLAQLDLAMGDADGAIHALRKAARLRPHQAEILATIGEIMVMKAAGKVDAQAGAMFHQALSVDPASQPARYFLGRQRIGAGDVAPGLAAWRILIGELPAGDPRREGLASEISAVEKTGALPPTADSQARPPSEVSGAIAGMVEGLAGKLQANPDNPAGWVRLVRANTVMGQTAKRNSALASAQRRYAARPDILRQLLAAATSPR